GLPDRAYLVNYTAIGGTAYDPEWTIPRTTAAQLAGPPAAVPGNAYIAKNASYTYADSNNLCLAVVSPQTGEVVLQSFYRPWQFRDASQPATATGLEPNNPNWTKPQGRYLVLRPRPVDQLTVAELGTIGLNPMPPTLTGPQQTALNTLILQKQNSGELLPYPPSNADGSNTGDLQNLPGGYIYNATTGQFVARNDSVWVDIGLPPRKWNGKWIKPLVAALVMDLDGRVNLSAHGNNRGSGTPPPHASYAGYGPWEVNPNAVLNNPAE